MTTPAVATYPDVVKVRDLIKEDDPGTWDLAWKQKITPWDSGDIQPPLREVIESGDIDFPRQGRALVPGCGSGYDAIYIASALGLDTVGFDVAETAIANANKNLASAGDAVPSKVTFALGDFFALEVPEDKRFNVVYDYTFFVAIPPSRRADWGRNMAAAINPGGYLITLVFPIDPPTDVGPPFFVRPEHYAQVLGESFVKVLDKVPETSLPQHVGKERIIVWQRR